MFSSPTSSVHSLSVRKGDRIQAGDVIGRCGNSGNSTEPHLHVRAMDRSSVWFASGRPIRIDGEPSPASGEALANTSAKSNRTCRGT